MAENLKHTPLIDRHRAAKGRLVPFAGWLLPIQYEGIVAEHQAVRTAAGLFDVSHMGELRLRGPEAMNLANGLVTNDLAHAALGQAQYTCCCNEQGVILDDLILYKFAEDDVLVVCNASNREKIAAHFARHAANAGVSFTDESDDTALLALQGPAALGIIDAVGCELSPIAGALAPFRFQRTRLAGLPVTLARTGYTGEDGVEIFCRSADAPALWDALMASGSAKGLVPAGLGARDTLRLEARLSLYGNEIDETTHPLEAGLAWTVKLDKPHFIGKQALEQVKAQGLSRRLVGFEMTGRGVARHGYPLLSRDGAPVGVCTSGGPAPTVGKNIGLGYVPVELSEIGTEFKVDCRGKAVDAVVVPTPFYKRPSAS